MNSPTFWSMIEALGNKNNDDAYDFVKGARYINPDVTLARRYGQLVNFVQKCSCSCCWYWEFMKQATSTGKILFEPGQRIYHFSRQEFEFIRDEHGGKCPSCGNKHTSGATGEAMKTYKGEQPRTDFEGVIMRDSFGDYYDKVRNVRNQKR